MANKKQILTEEQIGFLQFAAKHSFIRKNYYLTGGTPLAAFYLHHRYSEDLDFFTEDREVNLVSVQALIKNCRKKFKLKDVSYQNYQGLHTFSLKYPNGNELKTDFNYYPFPRVEKGGVKYGVETDSLLDIAVNKLQTIGTRTKTRDFVDLFFIIQEAKYTIPELMKSARAKFDFFIEPTQYGKQFVQVTKLKDYPRMIKPLNKNDMWDFFLNEAQKLGREIFK